MNHKGTIKLVTDRLLLRRFTLDDADAMFQNWANDPKVTEFLMWKPHGCVDVTKHVLADWIPLYAKPDYYQWGIEIKQTHELIGSIAAVHIQENVNMVHIGYCIGRDWWHKGYTSESFAELIRFFFDEVGANRIEARHDTRNPNSGKVMQKCGLQYEGTHRQSDWNTSGLCDASYYAILAEDYQKG
ncbi:MAG: GNAT family N-acetyltransferase [Clostridiaceae bacterium]|nr:GNAT family N-acetyltransferase [Clostridiaceae bacterium]